jgi:PQQ-dependent dehydrogenase (methanol/ethanol family)
MTVSRCKFGGAISRALLAGTVAWTTAGMTSVVSADSGKEWTIYGGDYANTRYSALDQINTGNVKDLKVSWIHSLGSTHSQETTPLVIGDRMYLSTSAGPAYVFALDAATGEMIWSHEPEMPPDYQSSVCCGHANRGLAYADGRLFMGRLDGELVALDAESGKQLWQTTVGNYKDGFSLTSPPLIVKDMVITGLSGGEYGVRGSLQAYDQETGELRWRTYSIPGPGEPGNETWKGDSWKTGGGAPWYVGSYDPELDLIYYGTSNAAPWGGHTRGNDSSNIGQYPNLYTASQLALDPDDGKIVWSYQMTPADVWDYDGVNEGVLVNLKISNQEVPALVKADRNGFFYVLNRANGQLISAEPFVKVNWAERVDRETGHPVANPEFRPQLDKWARNICPNLFGGKNWPPMSYSKQSGLVYIPTFNLCMSLVNREQEFVKGSFYLAQEFDLGIAGEGDYLGQLKAWDPVTQKQVWGIKEDLPFLSGVLSTAGGLVFYGNAHGIVKGVDANSGEVLWSFNAGSGVNQGPVTYAIDGKQYLAVVSGRLVGPPSFAGEIGERVTAATPPGGNVLVFELGG